VRVDWPGAQAFCDWLAGRSGRPVRLPSEAEWECACRAGSRSEFCFGDSVEELGAYAWSGQNSNGEAHEVGTREPNGFGLYDLHGNAWEWCEDQWHADYADAPSDGAAWTALAGSASPASRVLRGGSWYPDPLDCRSANRAEHRSGDRWLRVGFRPAMDATED